MPYLTAAHNALVLVVPKGALIAYSNECSRSDIAVAYRTFTVAFVTETADGNAGLLAAHDKVPEVED